MLGGFNQMSDKLNSLLQKGPTVLGAQASSPARVPPKQQPLIELVPLDMGRRGRPRSQDRGAFFARGSKAYRTGIA